MGFGKVECLLYICNSVCLVLKANSVLGLVALVINSVTCVIGQQCGSVAHWSEFSHARGPRSGHVPFSALRHLVGLCSGSEQQRDCHIGSGMVPSRFGDKSN